MNSRRKPKLSKTVMANECNKLLEYLHAVAKILEKHESPRLRSITTALIIKAEVEKEQIRGE